MAATGHAVIMQNKGGGHGEIGYHLAKALQAKGLKVTMLQDMAAKKSKVPYSLYDADLKDVEIAWIDPEDMQGYTDAAAAAVKDGPPVTHIFDNYSKSPGQIEPLLALANSPDFKLYTFISSAGMYTAKGKLSEDQPIKDPPTGQREVELKLDAALPKKWSSFRPQYIYGPYTNKRGYLDWFLERAVRGLPLPVPGDASQPVNVAHCEDVASLLSSVVGKEEAAGGEVFNCGTSSNVTYQELCDAAGKAVGKPVEVVSIAAGTKTSFPFRPNQEGFYVNVDKAKSKLGWEGAKYNVLDDIAAEGFYTKDYMSLGLDKGDIDTSKDYQK
jgi:nucleoside-diphosphate-sugar epimerase